MSQALRLPEILALARAEGGVTVGGLVAHFGVTPQTIRKDLADLAEAGELERVHGGAVLASATRNIEYEARRALNQDAKARIAQAVAARVPNNASLFLNIGTTTEAVAAALRDHTGLLVVTNNLNVAQILSGQEGVEVMLTGGRLRAADNGLVGHLACQTVRQFRVDLAVIGCSALSPEGVLLDFDAQEVEVSQAIIAHAARVVLAADGSKFERSAPMRIADLSAVDRVVTDRPVPARFAEAAAQAGTEVSVAPAPGS